MWYHATVDNHSVPGVVDLLFDDGVVIHEVEEHLIQTNIPFLSGVSSAAESKEAALFNNNFYDAGVYVRGDYVEVWKSPETGWKRGRIASDKKNGCYDIRLENGFDEIYRGRFMRFHFRSKDIVDIRVKHSTIWKNGRIVKQEKSGTSYIVHYDDSKEAEREEKNVSVYRLMPANRQEMRRKSVEYSQQLEELISRATSHGNDISGDQSSTVSTSVHALKYSREVPLQKDNNESVIRQAERTHREMSIPIPSEKKHYTNPVNSNHHDFPPPSYPGSEMATGDNHQRKVNNRQQRQQELKRETHQPEEAPQREVEVSSPVPSSGQRNIPSLPSSSVTIPSSSHVKSDNVGNGTVPGLITPLKEEAEKLNKFIIGEKVFCYDEKSGGYQAASIHSFNVEEGTVNVTTVTGTALSSVQLRFLVKEDRLHAGHGESDQSELLSLQKPPPLKMPETGKVEAVKKPHYKKGLNVQVEVEVNQFESVTVEGSIVNYLGEGQYSVTLVGETDERIFDESCVKPLAAISSQAQRNALNKSSEEADKKSFNQTGVNHPVVANLEANLAKVRIQENEEVLRFKHFQSSKPSTTRMRHALSYGNEEEMLFNLSLAEGEGTSFDYLNSGEGGRRNRADTRIDDLLQTKTVPYTIGMNVSYQPPAHQAMGKSYIGIIQKINERNQTVSLLLEFGNVVENVSFHCILPFSFDSNPSHHYPSSVNGGESYQSIVPQRPSQEKRSTQPFQRKGAGILVSPSSPGIVSDRKHSISGSSSHHWHFGFYSQPSSISSSSSWKSVIVYYENKNHSFRNYSKIWKEKQFQVRILTENKVLYDVCVLENTQLASFFSSSSSSPTIPFFLAFPSMEEKDYLTIFWKERALSAKKPVVPSSTMYLIVFEKMKAVTIAQVPLSSSSSPSDDPSSASLAFNEMIFQSISSEKRQVVDYINNDSSLSSSSLQVINNPEITTQILLPVWELYSCFSREEIVEKFPVFSSLTTVKEEENNERKSQNSRVNGESSSERKKIILVNILLPGNKIASNKLLSRLESLFLSSFRDLFVTFHYYQTSPSFSAALTSSSGISKHEGLNGGKTNRKNVMNSFASIYQSIRRNMKLSLLFLFFPISFSQQLTFSSSAVAAANRGDSSMLRISDYDMFQALTNILQNAFPVNSSLRTKDGDVGTPPDNRKRSSHPSDVLSLLQFWEFQCFNLKSLFDSSSSRSSSCPSSSRIVGIKWKYWLQFVPYFKLMICYLLVKKILELTLQPSSDAAADEEVNVKRRSKNEGRKGPSSRRGSREDRSSIEEPIAIDDGYEDYYDWFLALQSCSSISSSSSASPLSYDYSLSALLLYYDFLTILENHFHILLSISSSATSRRGNEESEENNFFPLKEILISLQQRYSFYCSASSSASGDAANEEEAIEEKNILYCWNEVFPSFLLKYYSYFIGQQLSENLNSLLSLLWEKTKVFTASASASSSSSLRAASENPQERQRTRTKSDEKTKISIFESLDIYCIALPNHIHFSSASSSRPHRRSHRSASNTHNGNHENGGTGSGGEYQYFLFYCNSLYHDQILLPFLQSLNVPIQQHNSSHYFLSIKDFPFLSIYDESQQVGDIDDEGVQGGGEGADGRGSGNGSSASSSPRVRSRSRSHSSHRSRSNSHHNRRNSSDEGSDDIDESEREKKSHSHHPHHHHQSPRRSNIRRSHHQQHPIKEEEDVDRDNSNSDDRDENNEERERERERKREQEKHNNHHHGNNSNKKEEFSLQQDFCDQLSDLLKLSSSASSSSSMILQQLQFATNQFMKEGFYCLSDLAQLPNFLFKKHLLPNAKQPSSLKGEEKKEILSKLLSDYLKDLQVSLFLQVKLIPYLVSSSP
jgi:hypothetical protein